MELEADSAGITEILEKRKCTIPYLVTLFSIAKTRDEVRCDIQ